MDCRAARFRLRRFLSGTVQRGRACQRIRKMLPVSTRQSPCTRRSIHVTLLGMAVWALLTPATPASAQMVSLEPYYHFLSFVICFDPEVLRLVDPERYLNIFQ